MLAGNLEFYLSPAFFVKSPSFSRDLSSFTVRDLLRCRLDVSPVVSKERVSMSFFILKCVPIFMRLIQKKRCLETVQF